MSNLTLGQSSRAAKARSQDPWKTSRRGDPYITKAGLTVSVYARRRGGFVWRATAWGSKASVESPEPYLTEEHAKAAALKALPETRRSLEAKTSFW